MCDITNPRFAPEEQKTAGKGRNYIIMILTTDLDDYITRCKNNFENFLREAESQATNLTRIVVNSLAYGLIKPEYGKWLNQCLTSQNWQELNNLIFQTTRHSFIPRGSIRCDHSFYLTGCLNALACGDYSIIERALPYELDLSQNGYLFDIIGVNLLMGLWYKDETFLEKTLPTAQKFVLSQKPQWEKAVIAYMISLYYGDVNAARIHLQKVCELYKQQNKDKFKKQLCIEAHGLYCLARCILLPEQFRQIRMPVYKNFSNDYALWRIRHFQPELNLYFEYPSPMELINKIYMTPIVKSINYQLYPEQHCPYLTNYEKLEWILDNDSMVEHFVENINKT